MAMSSAVDVLRRVGRAVTVYSYEPQSAARVRQLPPGPGGQGFGRPPEPSAIPVGGEHAVVPYAARHQKGARHKEQRPAELLIEYFETTNRRLSSRHVDSGERGKRVASGRRRIE